MIRVKRSKRSMLLPVVMSVVLLAASGPVLAGDPSYRPLREGELFREGFHYTESIDMMFDVTLGGALSLGTTVGSVRINTWTRNQVRLVITKTATAANTYNARTILQDFLVQARQKGGDLDLQGVANSESCKKKVGVTFEVWVPQDYNVDINTGSGNVDIGKINGTFSAKTGEGKISFQCDPKGMDIEVEDNSHGKAPDSRDEKQLDERTPARGGTAGELGAGGSGETSRGDF
jgi:hypothetical protein